MSRSVLVVGSVLLLGLGVVLYLLMRDTRAAGSGSTSTTATTATTTPPGTPGASAPDDRPRLADGTPIAREGEPGGPPPVDPNGTRVTPRDTPRGQGGAAPPPDDDQVGNIHVRDHRSGDQAAIDIPVPVHMPEGPRIDSSVTAALGKYVRTALYDCMKSLKREGRGERPRIEGQLVTNVKANTISVASVIIQPRDLDEADTAALKSCMEPQLVGKTAPAPNQADLDSYPISVSLPLP